MFELDDSDYEPLAKFGLLWRWTSPRYNELPIDALQRIRPLAHERAALVSDYAVRRVHRRYPDLGVNPDSVHDIQVIDANREPESAVKDWLLALPVSVDETVIVSWNASLAVTAPFALIAEYWSDFFYGASEDAAIVPPSVAWMLVWDHEEHFSFGITSQKPPKAR